MGKLIPFKKSMLKQMGIVNTKNGPMVDSSKLVDQKKYQKQEPKNEKKEIKKADEKILKRPRISLEEKQKLESRGIY